MGRVKRKKVKNKKKRWLRVDAKASEIEVSHLQVMVRVRQTEIILELVPGRIWPENSQALEDS